MMKLEIDRKPENFRCGEPISGVATWENLPEGTTHLEARLIWYTSGKGTRDFDLIAALRIETPHAAGEHHFQFIAPHRPFSFSGDKLSLQWGIELLMFPSKDSLVKEICISPTGQEILLEKNFDDEIKNFKSKIVDRMKN